MPPPVHGATLLSLFVYVRHGARAPAWADSARAGDVWHCGRRVVEPPHRIPRFNGHRVHVGLNPSESHAFPPDCQELDLLDIGFDQHEALGAAYRNYTTRTTGLLPEEYDPALVSVLSTYTPRTIASAVGFMHGLYPPKKDGETLLINETWVHEHWDFEKLWQDPLFNSRVKESKKILKPILKFFNWTRLHPFNVLDRVEAFMPRKCSNHSIDEIVTDELYERMMWDQDFFYYRLREVLPDSGFKTVWKEIDERIEDVLTGRSPVRFRLISDHDTMVAQVAAGFGGPYFMGRPPFASHVGVEVWQLEEPCLRVVGNGQVIKVRGQELTALSELRERFLKN
jgi:hypothetical protein